MTTFDDHWAKIADDGIPENKRNQARDFLNPAMYQLRSNRAVREEKILDAGCGDGVHISVLFDDYNKNNNILCYAVDIAKTAIKKVEETFHDEDVEAAVGDIQAIQQEDGYFDLVISYGVVAYVDDPEKAMRELMRTLSSGGILALWIYPAGGMLKQALFRGVRNVCQFLGPQGTSLLCHCLVPIMSLLPVTSGLSLKNSSWKACHEVLMVNLNPAQLKFLKQEKVIEWIEREGGVVLDVENALLGAIYARKG